MTDKDNIKLNTDTLSSRRSGSSVGVHVKRKRKIITKPSTTKAPDSSRSIKKEVKKGIVKENPPKEPIISKASPVKDPTTTDPKATKKHKIDKDEKIEKMENKELHLKSPSYKKDKRKMPTGKHLHSKSRKKRMERLERRLQGCQPKSWHIRRLLGRRGSCATLSGVIDENKMMK